MRIWVIILKTFGYIWLTLASILILVGIIGVWMKEGFSGVQSLLSPFNIINWILTVLTLAPGLGALALVSKLQEKIGKAVPNQANAADR
jgi:hypothetical protein